MSATFQQTVTVRPGGVVEIRSPELHEGEQAQVTVVVLPPLADGRANSKGGWQRFAGAVTGKDIQAANNERIDADLAEEFGGRANAES